MGLVTPRDRRRLLPSAGASIERRDVGRRVRAACKLADLTLLDAARATGINYVHLVAIANGREPLTSTDRRDLAAVLGCPEHWLTNGWGD